MIATALLLAFLSIVVVGCALTALHDALARRFRWPA